VWKNYNVTEEILEEDGNGETNTIKMGEWNSEFGNKSHQNIVQPLCTGKEKRDRSNAHQPQ
jgi:hypothetical protein